MNPLKWKREHQVALLVAALIGIIIGPLIGYALYALGSGAEGAGSLYNWLFRYSSSSGWIWAWALFGAALAAAIVYVLRLARS